MIFYVLPPSLLPKSDKRYKKWLKSLKKRPPVWNKGKNRNSHPGVAKISETFKNKKIDNFRQWRLKMIKLGKFNSSPKELKKDGELAELIGVILGDGHIARFPRTEALTIVSNAKNKGFIERYDNIIYKVFDKKPVIYKARKGCVRIRIYQKYLSVRLGIPIGNRSKSKIEIPNWIKNNTEYLERYLRGLYEAEGSFSVHKPTYTYKLSFSNRNNSLLKNVFEGLVILGFHPHKSKYQIQVSRKQEVYQAKKLLEFRKYK